MNYFTLACAYVCLNARGCVHVYVFECVEEGARARESRERERARENERKRGRKKKREKERKRERERERERKRESQIERVCARAKWRECAYVCVSMCACVSTCFCACVYACMRINTHTYAHTTFIRAPIYTAQAPCQWSNDLHTCVCVCAYLSVCLRTLACVRVPVYTPAHVPLSKSRPLGETAHETSLYPTATHRNRPCAGCTQRHQKTPSRVAPLLQQAHRAHMQRAVCLPRAAPSAACLCVCGMQLSEINSSRHNQVFIIGFTCLSIVGQEDQMKLYIFTLGF